MEKLLYSNIAIFKTTDLFKGQYILKDCNQWVVIFCLTSWSQKKTKIKVTDSSCKKSRMQYIENWLISDHRYIGECMLLQQLNAPVR